MAQHVSLQPADTHFDLLDRSRIDALASAKGEWVIEGYGVDPDINVENDPKSVLAGHDPQLERTVAELMKQLQGRKVQLPPPPAAPVKAPK